MERLTQQPTPPLSIPSTPGVFSPGIRFPISPFPLGCSHLANFLPFNSPFKLPQVLQPSVLHSLGFIPTVNFCPISTSSFLRSGYLNNLSRVISYVTAKLTLALARDCLEAQVTALQQVVRGLGRRTISRKAGKVQLGLPRGI